MAYFGPTGIKGERIHPSLRIYIDCFYSPPFPKMFPRGGGYWDQDPVLMRHFRIIRKFDLEWKQAQEQIEDAKSNTGFSGSGGGGGTAGIGNALNQYIDSLDE